MDLRDFPCYRAETGKSGDGLALDWQHYHAVTVIRMSLVCSAISGGHRGRPVRERRMLVNDLRHAIANDELDVHYQVQTSVSTGGIQRLRGAAALAAPRARPDLAGRVHPAGRGERPDPAARRMGAAAIVPRRCAVGARLQGRGQPVERAALAREPPGAGRAHPARVGAAARAAGAGADRDRGRPRQDAFAALHPGDQGARRHRRPRRLRHRLFVARHAAHVSLRQDQA